jgi:hypothetical protein
LPEDASLVDFGSCGIPDMIKSVSEDDKVAGEKELRNR